MNGNIYILSILNSVLSITFLISLLEAFTYAGFFAKHFRPLFGVGTVMLLAVLFLVFKKFGESKLFRNAISVAAFLFVAAYVMSDILEKLTYPNFIFSHFHFQTYLLLLSAILMACLFLLNESEKRIRILIYTALIFVFGQYLITDFATIKGKRPVFILKNINLSYDKKMEMTIGKVVYDYAIFIKNKTPANATILIPPQAYPWDKTSNVAYLRYFLYPRNLINGDEKDPKVDIQGVDYVLIDYGETNISQYGYTNVWPKFNVVGVEITYWDPTSGKTWQDKTGDYRYDPKDSSEKWGIIKIKN